MRAHDFQSYYRGTNNINEPKLIHDKLIRPSKNHLSGNYEKGLSVSDTLHIAKFFKYVYKVSGKEIGLGSDGEPILDINTIKFIKWIKK
jgi:hypothetical protein